MDGFAADKGWRRGIMSGHGSRSVLVVAAVESASPLMRYGYTEGYVGIENSSSSQTASLLHSQHPAPFLGVA